MREAVPRGATALYITIKAAVSALDVAPLSRRKSDM